MNILVLAASAILATTVPAHHVAIDHQDQTYRLSYTPTLSVDYRTIGMSAGLRPSSERCRWTGTVQVERHVHADNGRRLSKTLPQTHRVEGSRHGSCLSARPAIDREIAARHDVAAHVRQVAAADRDDALADIGTSRSLALN